MKEIKFGQCCENNIVVALGYFDCVHIGHRLLIKKTMEIARKNKCDCAVLTFGNNPFEILGKSVSSVYSYRERCGELENLGVEIVLKAVFNDTFMNMTANEFLSVLGKYNLKGITYGYDFTFGKNKEGTAKTIENYCLDKGLDFFCMEEYKAQGSRVSSTQVRRFLSEGRINEVNEFLGAPYKIMGQVVRGDGRGAILGFPTANIYVGEKKLLPKDGVYSARCVVDGAEYKVMLHIGTRPTYGGGENRIEAHLIGFDGNLYGKDLCIRIVRRLRGIKEFSGSEELKLQLKKDKGEIAND